MKTFDAADFVVYLACAVWGLALGALIVGLVFL